LGLALTNLYFGARVTGFLGGTDIDVTDRSLLYGAELGYGPRIHIVDGTYLVLRAQLGAGGASIFHTDPSSVSASSSASPRVSRGGRTRPNVDVISAASVSSGGGGTGGAASDTTTVTSFYVEPGVSAAVTSGIGFVGAVGSLLVLPGIRYGGADPSTWVSYGITAQAGLSF
jgi:hypothetical protein